MTRDEESNARAQLYGSDQCDEATHGHCVHLTRLLDRVEDDRAHAEAVKLRHLASEMALNLLDPFSPQKQGWLRYIADRIDPYEERDGQLFRKLDGKPVTL